MKALKTLYRFCSSWTGTIIIVLLLIFFIAQAFVIPSRSMVGTLYEGDFLFVKKFSYGIPIPRIPWIEIPVLPDLKEMGISLPAICQKEAILSYLSHHISKKPTLSNDFLQLVEMR